MSRGRSTAGSRPLKGQEPAYPLYPQRAWRGGATPPLNPQLPAPLPGQRAVGDAVANRVAGALPADHLTVMAPNAEDLFASASTCRKRPTFRERSRMFGTAGKLPDGAASLLRLVAESHSNLRTASFAIRPERGLSGPVHPPGHAPRPGRGRPGSPGPNIWAVAPTCPGTPGLPAARHIGSRRRPARTRLRRASAPCRRLMSVRRRVRGPGTTSSSGPRTYGCSPIPSSAMSSGPDPRTSG